MIEAFRLFTFTLFHRQYNDFFCLTQYSATNFSDIKSTEAYSICKYCILYKKLHVAVYLHHLKQLGRESETQKKKQMQLQRI